jgi:hypothetical protein
MPRNSEFFMDLFDLIREDLLKVVEESRGQGMVTLNATFLALIPNYIHPNSFKEFMPIYLCNVVYKLISKVIDNRPKPFLSSSISNEQFGFLFNRQILDAIGSPQEVLHSIKTKNIPSFILQLDPKKVYDKVNWSFLRLVLLQIGLTLTVTN